MTDPTGLKATLRGDLTAAMKARDRITTATLRMALTAITNAEVAGSEARTLSDDDVLAVLTKEVKKRHESIHLYQQAGREDLAAQEEAEAEVLEQYLPQQLTDEELAALVTSIATHWADAHGEQASMKHMGLLIKEVKEKAGAQAEGARIAAAVKSALSH